jgi:hypothetical protein
MTSKTESLMFLIACILISAGLFAQPPRAKAGKARPGVPAWVSEKGYWVVESNIHSPYRHTVFFYNNDNVLMYKESLEGVKLNAEKRKVKMKLKKALETSALVWHSPNELPGGTPADRSIVMTALK